jgi:hypothetical protein
MTPSPAARSLAAGNLFGAVLGGVMLYCFFAVLYSVHGVAMRDARVVARLFMIARRMMLGGCPVVFRRMFMMFGRFVMMF